MRSGEGERWTGTVTSHTAVGDRVVLNVGFHAARTRLRSLVRGDMLQRACEVAYGEGITALARLAGPASGPTRLADVCLADLTDNDDCVHVALQWNAIAASGRLFTALLAEMKLVPAGEQTSVLFLAGAYWPPPVLANAEQGSVAVRSCATAVARTLLNSVACELCQQSARPCRLPSPADRGRAQWRVPDSKLTAMIRLR